MIHPHNHTTTPDGTLLLKWVESGDVSELAKSYEALKQMDKQIAHIVSDDSKTSHFSMLPGMFTCFDIHAAMLEWSSQYLLHRAISGVAWVLLRVRHLLESP